MRVGGFGGPAVGLRARRAPPSRHEPQASEPGSRALIAVAPAAPTARSLTHTRHPAAPFLAQLIATQMQAPQTRARRRAEPEEATAHYQAATAPSPARGTFGKLS
jgi:hypothetical protein